MGSLHSSHSCRCPTETSESQRERSVTVKTFCVLGSILYALAVVLIGKFCGLTSTPDVASSESLARLAVKDGGGVWVGIQECEGLPSLILFNSPVTGSTLALKTSELTADNVRRRIEESDAAFKAFDVQRGI